ncbi:MAG: polysaccharide export protein [Candidatus Latescibacterota bacterium]|nr:MAG: polysaccharide export protein [Candidatus Latescibacterota bacterium]
MYDTSELGEFLRDTDESRGENTYTIGVGDRLDVIFFIHRDLSTPNLLVRSDGRITLPYVGDVMAAGYTPMALDSTLTARFAEVLREPNLSVIVSEPAPKQVYVLGQVAKPGAYPYDVSVSLLQAVALAGGPIRGAKSNHVLVIRREGSEKIVGVEVNLAAVMEGRTIQNDIWLRNYDIVYVPKTRLESGAELFGAIHEILSPPSDILLRGWQIQLLQQQVQLLRDR